jgi:LCP family protein required for cell wall assembly
MHYPRMRRTAGLLVAAAAVTIILWAWHERWEPLRRLPGSVAARVTLGTQPLNILLIANNARGVAADNPLGLGTAAGQADVIILAHLDPVAHVIDAITIPRDLLFAQPGWHDPVPKIKTLFFMGNQETPPQGPRYLADAVAALTGLHVDGYLVANFAGFEEAVNAVGGLDIDVKQRIYDPRYSGADFMPGIHHMNGAQVLAFVRVRQNQAGNAYRVNDFQRMQAEVQVLGLLRDKLLDPAHAATLVPAFVARMRRDVATNLPEDRLVRIGIAMAGAPVYQVPLGSDADSMVLAPARIPGVNAEGRIEEADYDVLDTAAIQRRLAEFGSRSSRDGLPTPPPPADVRIVLYGTRHMALHLEHLGFVHIRLAGGPTGANAVYYPAAQPAAGWAVARALGTGNVYVAPTAGPAVVVDQ